MHQCNIFERMHRRIQVSTDSSLHPNAPHILQDSVTPLWRCSIASFILSSMGIQNGQWKVAFRNSGIIQQFPLHYYTAHEIRDGVHKFVIIAITTSSGESWVRLTTVLSNTEAMASYLNIQLLRSRYSNNFTMLLLNGYPMRPLLPNTWTFTDLYFWSLNAPLGLYRTGWKHYCKPPIRIAIKDTLHMHDHECLSNTLLGVRQLLLA
jgi:hypothetical protein